MKMKIEEFEVHLRRAAGSSPLRNGSTYSVGHWFNTIVRGRDEDFEVEDMAERSLLIVLGWPRTKEGAFKALPHLRYGAAEQTFAASVDGAIREVHVSLHQDEGAPGFLRYFVEGEDGMDREDLEALAPKLVRRLVLTSFRERCAPYEDDLDSLDLPPHVVCGWAPTTTCQRIWKRIEALQEVLWRDDF